MIYKISTTGSVAQVVLPDMGARTIEHPTEELDLGLEYSESELLSSEDLNTAISNGWLILVEKSGGYATTEEVETITSGIVVQEIEDQRGSGEIPTKFTDLTDTPETYPGHSYFYAVSSASGIAWKSDYLDSEIHVSPSFVGDSNGSATNPFRTIAEAAAFSYVTYSGTGKSVAVIMHPGEYIVPHQIVLDLPELKAFVGTDSKTVVVKPTADLIGLPFIDSYVPVEAANMTIDATDIPDFATTAFTVGVRIMDDSFEENTLRDIRIKGFHRGLASFVESNIWARQLEIHDATIGVCVASGCLFDADMLYVDGCRERHLSVIGGAEAYIGSAELSSAYVDGLVGSGIAVYAEGNNTYVELFAGTNIWSCAKNLVVEHGAEVKVDNCVLEETTQTPGIEQHNNSRLTIVNSRAPLGTEDVSIETPDNVYINAFDSSEGATTMGNGSQDDQTIFTINTGGVERPGFTYHPAHGVGNLYRAVAFGNPTTGENTAFFVEAKDGDVSLAAHPIGPNAFSNLASINLVSVEDGVGVGWGITKEAGETPNLVFKTKAGTTALTAKHSGEVKLNEGVYVNKILDDDTFASNDDEALATQQSIKAFVENYTYSSAVINTISGSLDTRMLYADGSKQLTGDWNAGDYIITSSGFASGNARVDYANFSNITGILTGGALSVNAVDDTLLDIEAGTALYVDMSDRDAPIVEKISWPAQTWDPELAGGITKWIGIERTAPGIGTLIAQHKFSQSQRRTITLLGRIWNFDEGDDIKGVGQYKYGAFNSGKTIQDLTYALGSINISGNSFTATASGVLRLNRTAGEAFRAGANYSSDNTSPNIYASVTVSGIDNYSYHIQGDAAENKAYLEPNYYDLSGIKTAVPTDKWTIQRVYYYPVSNVVLVTYGQYLYDNYDEAVQNLTSESLVLNSETLEGAILRSFIVLKEGCTDLTDGNQATIVEASQFGSGGGGTGATTHSSLLELNADDHLQYIRVDGARGFTSTVAGVTPVLDNDLVTKSYVDDNLSTISSGIVQDHGELTGLSDDDHTQYLLANGTRELSADWDAGDFIINSAGFKKDNVRIDYSIFSCSTGLLTGGNLSVNAVDDTLLDVAAGTALYVDMTDRDAPVIEKISWPAQTYDPDLNGGVTKWIGVQRTSSGVGTLTASHKFTQAERRVITVLGRIWNFDEGDDIKGVGNYKAGTFNTGKTVQDLAYALGAFNISGNSFFPTASGSLVLSRSSGEAFRFSANYTADNTSPNIYLSPPASGIDNYSYHIQGDAAENLPEINPDYYDLDGTKTAVPSGKWTIQRVYYYPVSNVVLVTYGQYLYDDKDDALAKLSTEDLQLNSETLEGAILRAFLVLQEGCTDLTNDTQAEIIESLQFGASGGGGGGSGVEDHGLLTGLSDDDHPQYHNDARGDARYYTQEQVNTISGALADQLVFQDSSLVQVRRTTDFTPTTSWQTVTFDTLDIESEAGNLEWDESNKERFLIKADGLYEISYSFPARSSGATREVYARVLIDGTTEIAGSYTNQDLYQNETHQQDRTFSANLLANTYISLEIRVASTPVNVLGNQLISIAKLDSVKGDKGDPGETGATGEDGIDAGGTLAVVQARRTTQYTNIPLSWVDLEFDTTDIEYDDTVLEHDNTNRDRILIKRTGYYWIGCHFTVDDEARCRIRVNDTTVIPGSDRQSGDIADTNQIITMMANPVVAQLSAGDFITVQIQAVTSDEFTFEGATLIVYELIGAKGDKGDPGTPGSGSTVNIYDTGSPVANTPHSLLNFTGAGVSVADVDGDQVNITIPGGISGLTIQDESSTVTGGPHHTLNFTGSLVTASNVGSGVATVSIQPPVFGTGFFSAADESETNTNSASPVAKVTLSATGLSAGTYRIGWYLEWRRNTANNDYSATVVIDGTTTAMAINIEPQEVNAWHSISGFYIDSLTSGNHSIVLSHFGESTGNTSYTRRARLEIWRVS